MTIEVFDNCIFYTMTINGNEYLYAAFASNDNFFQLRVV